jgi:hypothetical protein
MDTDKRMAAMISLFARFVAFLCILGLTTFGRAETPPVPIRDDAGLFHADAIARAERRIADIRRTFDRNLFVRTIASVSSNSPRWFPYLRTPQVNRMLEENARRFADEAGLPGIYVVICNRPRDVRVLVRPNDDTAFTRHDAEALRRNLARSLHENGMDGGLIAGVYQVYAILQDHKLHGSTLVAGDVVLGALLVGLLVVWLLLALLRMRLRAGRTEEANADDAALRARESAVLLGAMFGCPAAQSVYEKLGPFRSNIRESEGENAEVESMERVDGEDLSVPDSAEDAAVLP